MKKPDKIILQITPNHSWWSIYSNNELIDSFCSVNEFFSLSREADDNFNQLYDVLWNNVDINMEYNLAKFLNNIQNEEPKSRYQPLDWYSDSECRTPLYGIGILVNDDIYQPVTENGKPLIYQEENKRNKKLEELRKIFDGVKPA